MPVTKWLKDIIYMKNLMSKLKKLKDMFLVLSYLQQRYFLDSRNEKQPFLYIMAPISESKSPTIQTPDLQSDLNVGSNDLGVSEHRIKAIGWKVSTLNHQKSKAMSLSEFYECAKQIRREKENLVRALLHYKSLEQKYDLAVNLEYRSVLKKLTK